MLKKAKLGVAIVAALGFGALGCGDDDQAGTGGTGGTGATGGTGGSGGAGGGVEMAMVRVAHLAPEVPTAGDTNVDILIDGATAIEDLEFAEATDFVELPVGNYIFGIAVAGDTTPVFEFPATLEADAILTVVAYRTVASGAAAPVGVLVFDGTTNALLAGSGRVLVGHGADDTLLDPVNVITPANCPPILLEDFEFGSQTPTPLDLPAGDVQLAFQLTSSLGCQVDAGPLVADVTADVVTILVAVDNDVTDNMLGPAIYAIVDDFSGNDIPTLPAAP
ncbi:MAG: DUF4397 domain-containing protein [Myxococcales bacterium]|nr:DUF4397 domain-containing protein [Myxococcales bacterium]